MAFMSYQKWQFGQLKREEYRDKLDHGLYRFSEFTLGRIVG